MRRVDRSRLNRATQRLVDLEARAPVDRPETRTAYWLAIARFPFADDVVDRARQLAAVAAPIGAFGDVLGIGPAPVLAEPDDSDEVLA